MYQTYEQHSKYLVLSPLFSFWFNFLAFCIPHWILQISSITSLTTCLKVAVVMPFPTKSYYAITTQVRPCQQFHPWLQFHLHLRLYNLFRPLLIITTRTSSYIFIFLCVCNYFTNVDRVQYYLYYWQRRLTIHHPLIRTIEKIWTTSNSSICF